MTREAAMSMTRRHVVAAALAALAALPAAARAQNLGSLEGQVLDVLGVPIKGVTVTITSPTQIGGPKTTTTNDEGAFRFVGLIPGVFRVEARALRLKATVQDNVRVAPNVAIEITIIMEVETGVEEVKVVEKAPTVNVHKTSVGEDFDLEFVDKLPLPSRDYQGVASLAAGVFDDGSGNPQVRGGTYFNNSYTVDGFDTTDPVTHTFGQNFSFNAMSNVQVETAAKGAEHSDTLGAATNIVTRSGSNRVEVDAIATYTDQNMRLFKDNRDLDTKSRFTAGAVAVGGPIVKDRVWYFGSVEGTSADLSLPREEGFPDHPALDQLSIDAFGKINWQITSRNKLELRGSVSRLGRDNALQSYLVEAEAEAKWNQRTESATVQWHYLALDNLFLVTQASYLQQELHVRPQSCEWDPNCMSVPGEVDLVSGFSRYNFRRSTRDQRFRWSFGERIEWFPEGKRWGSHAITVGAKARLDDNDVAQTVPGDSVLFKAGAENFARREICSNDPKLDNGLCRKNMLRSEVQSRGFKGWIEDKYRPTRFLGVTPGLAFHWSASDDDRQNQVTDIFAVTPHLAASWDATHDGKTALRASIDSAVDTGFLALARFTSRALYQKTCLWDPETQTYSRNCRSAGGNEGTTVGLPSGPDGVRPDGSPCTSRLIAARSWEYTLGAEREIVTGVSLSLDLIYRRFVNQWEDAETNAFWNQGGSGLDRSSPFRTKRSEFIFDLQTPEAARRTYTAGEIKLRKREGLLKAFASYTLGRYVGTDDSYFVTPYLDNPGQAVYEHGPLPLDIRHNIRGQVVYVPRNWISFGAVYQFISGRPYDRFFWDSEYQDFSRRAAQRGHDSRGNLDPDDDIPLRTPDLSELGLQVRFYLKPIIKKQLELWIDFDNVLALRTPTGVIEVDGPNWGRPAGRLPPLNLEVGARFKY
jgi:hypothetical protein